MGEAVRAVLEVAEADIGVGRVDVNRTTIVRLAAGARFVMVVVVRMMPLRPMVLIMRVRIVLVPVLVRLGRASLASGFSMVVVPQPCMQGDVHPWAELHPEQPHQRRPDRERTPPEHRREQ